MKDSELLVLMLIAAAMLGSTVFQAVLMYWQQGLFNRLLKENQALLKRLVASDEILTSNVAAIVSHKYSKTVEYEPPGLRVVPPPPDMAG